MTETTRDRNLSCGENREPHRRSDAPYQVVTWHGEARSIFYVVDADAPEQEQPAIKETARSYEDALAAIQAQDADETPRVITNASRASSS